MENTKAPVTLNAIKNALNSLLPEGQVASSVIAQDLKKSMLRVIQSAHLPAATAAMATLTLATAAGLHTLADAARKDMAEAGDSEQQISEAVDMAAFMAMLNTYYKFRNLMIDEQGEEVKTTYASPGLYMNIFKRTSLGEERFEMLAFAVSVYNGCGGCMSGHEKSLRKLSVAPATIHDLARLASVISGIAMQQSSLKS